MAYRISQIAQIIGAEPHHCQSAQRVVKHLQIDSRKINFPGESLFFALRGVAYDGHDFLIQAYQKGLRSFVVEQLPRQALPKDACLLLVADSLAALQQLCATHRSKVKTRIFGITGSNGKTIVKEWLYQLLESDYRVLRNPRSYNSQTGVPLSVWQLTNQHQLAFFEAGISQTGEMEKLATIIAPSEGIFTTLGPAHDAGFASRQQKLEEKLLLFKSCHTIYYARDQRLVHQTISQIYPDRQLRCWSTQSDKATLFLQKLQRKGTHSLLNAQYHGRSLTIKIPFTDRASIENALLCWLVALEIGVPDKVIAQRMAQLEPVAMRLELRPGINSSLIINDAYNNDLTSLEIALHFLRQQSSGMPRLLVLTDILQSAEKPKTLYQKVKKLLKEQNIDHFIGIGSEIQQLKGQVKGARFYPDTTSLLSQLDVKHFAGKAILLKGARRFHLEKLADRLSEKVHQTALEIKLDALAHNLRFYQKRLAPATRLLVMVKAAAYGSGAVEIARLLQREGVAYLGVAYADEGIALRQAGIDLPILVLNPEVSAFPLMLRYGLEPEIYSVSLLREYLRAIHHLPTAPGLHLKLETGMQRLGLSEEELARVVHLLKLHPQVQVQSVFSHLAASENKEKDDFTRLQAERFQKMLGYLEQALGYRPTAHLLNSEGIVRFPDWQFDMVRLGIGFYGISSLPEVRAQLQFALCLKSRISQIKTVVAGEPVGYGAGAAADRDRRIAVVGIGYADGLLRLAGNGRFSLEVHGKPAPTVGNICMDMCMIDISELPEVKEGDEVIVFDANKPIEELAEALHTIPYEVLTNISERVRRVYVF